MVQLGLDDAGLMRLLLFGPGQGLWRHSAGAATGPASLQLLCQAQQGHTAPTTQLPPAPFPDSAWLHPQPHGAPQDSQPTWLCFVRRALPSGAETSTNKAPGAAPKQPAAPRLLLPAISSPTLLPAQHRAAFCGLPRPSGAPGEVGAGAWGCRSVGWTG